MYSFGVFFLLSWGGVSARFLFSGVLYFASDFLLAGDFFLVGDFDLGGVGFLTRAGALSSVVVTWEWTVTLTSSWRTGAIQDIRCLGWMAGAPATSGSGRGGD